MKAIVSDAGPVLSFARAGQLDILAQIVEGIWIPRAVHEEIVIHGHGRPGSELPSWIRATAVTVDPKMHLSTKLGRGESEAIRLAQQLGAVLLIDERAGRREARRLGIDCFGSLRILEEAKSRGVIETVKPVLDRIVAAGMYLGEPLYISFLRRISED